MKEEYYPRKRSWLPGRQCRDITLLVLLVAFPLSLVFSTWSRGDNDSYGKHKKDGNPNSIPGGPDLPAEVGRLPFMGFNTWNAFHCDINQSLIIETAEYMVKHGFLDLGYNYINIDDCYSEKKRNDKGEIVESKDRFPDGMRHTVDRIHELGFKAGIYSDSGWYTCQMYPGSYLHEEQDIRTFQGNWGFDLLKFDNCAVPFDGIIKLGNIGKYSRMANAVTKVAKEIGKVPMLFSLCQWGRFQPWLWARHYGQSWRTTDDIGPRWNAITSIINQATRYSWATDFYGRNDLDILEVGNSDTFTYEEAKTHFTFWALAKSPLLISADLSKLTEQDVEILSNREIIALNQDPVYGESITPFRWGLVSNWDNEYTFPAQYWSMRSENGTVFLLLNVENEPHDMHFTFNESPWMRAGAQYSIRDLWKHEELGTYIRNYTVKNVPAHGAVVLLMRDVGDEPEGVQPPCAISEWCTDENGTIIDGGWGLWSTHDDQEVFNPLKTLADDPVMLVQDQVPMEEGPKKQPSFEDVARMEHLRFGLPAAGMFKEKKQKEKGYMSRREERRTWGNPKP